MKKNYPTFFLTVLLNILPTNTQAQTSSPYLSYDWAFFELKGRVRSVTTVYKDKYSETQEVHYFNANGELIDEEGDDFFGWQLGPTRDDRGRITGTGNGHWGWEWNGKNLVRADWAHHGDESSTIYLYNQRGKRTGYKDEDGKVYTYTYLNHDAKGNWIERVCEGKDHYSSEKRKIVYY